MSKIGLNDLSAMYVGSAEVGKAYLGNSVVYEKASEEIPDYLVIKANAPTTVGLTQQSSGHTLEYSYDGNTWATYYSAGTVISLSQGDKVCFRGTLTSNNSTSNYTKFDISGSVIVYGKILALNNYTNPDLENSVRQYAYYKLFEGCSAVTDVSNLQFNKLSTVNDFYSNNAGACESMFSGCVNLKHSPKEIDWACAAKQTFKNMFNGCTSLLDAPQLHIVRFPGAATQEGAYRMFYGCSALKTIPGFTIPIDGIPYGNYVMTEMFSGCSSLEYAPLTLNNSRNYAYLRMFNGCASLKESPILGFASPGYQACQGMFSGCSSLEKITCLSAYSSQDSWTGWVTGVPSTGLFVKSASETGWPTGNNGIPTGWTVQDYTEP